MPEVLVFSGGEAPKNVFLNISLLEIGDFTSWSSEEEVSRAEISAKTMFSDHAGPESNCVRTVPENGLRSEDIGH